MRRLAEENFCCSLIEHRFHVHNPSRYLSETDVDTGYLGMWFVLRANCLLSKTGRYFEYSRISIYAKTWEAEKPLHTTRCC